MKILHVVPSYLPATRYGGPIYSVHSLCKALVGLGHDVHVFTTNVDGPDNSPVPLRVAVDVDGVKVWYFPSQTLRRLYWSPSMMKGLVAMVPGVDVVHLHSVFLWPTWAAARVARRFGVPYVLSPRGMLVRELIRRKSALVKSLWIALIERKTIHHAALLHVTSLVEREDFDGMKFSQPSIAVIPNGVDVEQSPEAAMASDDVAKLLAGEPFILYLGRLNWKKGIDRLIAAMVAVSGYRLVIVGNDEENYKDTLLAEIERYHLGKRVFVLDRFVAGADKRALYEAASLFVLPSLSENFGITVTEALANGCPVVVTNGVGASEVVLQSGGGRVCSGAELGQTMQAFLADSTALAEAGQRGKAWVLANLGWNSIAHQMVAEYRRFSPVPSEKDIKP